MTEHIKTSPQRKIIYSMMMSLDGFVEDSNKSLDWVIIDEELHQFVNDTQSEVGVYLEGRRMHELMAEYWPTADEDPTNQPVEIEFSRIWKEMPKIVFSKTLEKVDWNAQLVREVSPDEIQKLKEQPGKAMEVGGPTLASTFLRLGLVDEYRVYVMPVILGSGTPMFPALDNSIPLHLVDTHQFKSGVILLRYERADGV